MLQLRKRESGVFLYENRNVWGRLLYKEEIAVVEDDEEAFSMIESGGVDLREVALVERKNLPEVEALLHRHQPPGKGETSFQLFRPSPNRVEIKATVDRPGLLVLTELFDKNWKARINDRRAPLLRVDYAFRGIPITAPLRDAKISMTYLPAGFVTGAFISAFTIFFMIFQLIRPVILKKLPRG